MWTPVPHVSYLIYTLEDFEDEMKTASQEAALAPQAASDSMAVSNIIMIFTPSHLNWREISNGYENGLVQKSFLL